MTIRKICKCLRISAFLTASFGALALEQTAAQAQEHQTIITSQPLTYDIADLRGFSLIIAQSHRSDGVSGQTLASGYQSNWFAHTPDGIRLASMSRHPDPWHRVKPATMLRLNAPLFLALQTFRANALMRVGPTPVNVNLDIMRFGLNDQYAPLTLFVHGDTINARICQDDRSCFAVVAGTLSARRSAHITLDARPGEMLELTVNGTHSHVRLTPAVTHQKLFFETGVGSDNDVYALPSPEEATLQALTIRL